MPWPWSRKPKTPSFKEQVNMQMRGNITERESTSLDELQDIPIEQRFFDDSKIQKLFEPTSDVYDPLLAPLSPFFSYMNWLTNDSKEDVEDYRLDLDIAVGYLENFADFRQRRLLHALKTFGHHQINSSREGFRIRALSESRRVLTLKEESENKGWFGRRKK